MFHARSESVVNFSLQTRGPFCVKARRVLVGHFRERFCDTVGLEFFLSE